MMHRNMYRTCLSRLLTRSSSLNLSRCSCISCRLMSVTVPVSTAASLLMSVIPFTVVDAATVASELSATAVPYRFFFIWGEVSKPSPPSNRCWFRLSKRFSCEFCDNSSVFSCSNV